MVFDIDIPDEDLLSDKNYRDPGIPNPVLLPHRSEGCLVCRVVVDLQHPDVEVGILDCKCRKEGFHIFAMDATIAIEEIPRDLCAGDIYRRKTCLRTACARQCRVT